MNVARALRRNTNTTRTTRTIADQQRPLHVARPRRESWSSGRWRHRMSIAAGSSARNCGSRRLDAIHRVDDVGAGLAEHHAASTAGLPLVRPAMRMSCTESDTFADVGEPHRRAVAVGDDQRLVVGRLEQLIGRADLDRSWSRPRSGPSADWRWPRASAVGPASKPEVVLGERRGDSARRARPAAHRRRRSPGPRRRPATSSARATDDATSYMRARGTVSDVSARIIAGASAGLTLR